MLNAMREGAHSKIVKFVIFSFLVLAVAGMTLMDVGGFFRGGTQNTTVATVAGEKISAMEFDRSVRRAISQQSMLDTKMAYQLGLIEQYLNSQISSILLQKDARKHGIIITDEAVAQRIAQLVAPYATNGTSIKDAFNRILLSQNMSEAEFTSMLRNEMISGLMRAGIQAPAQVVSEVELKDLYQQKNEQRTIKYVLFPHSSVKGIEKASDDVLRPFYQAGQEKYAIPETRTLTLGVLNKDSVLKTLDISDEELQQVYDERIDEYTEKEKRVLEQAIFTSEGEANETYEKVKSGSSLKEASGSAYIGSESFESAGLLQEISEPAFSLAINESTQPVKTSLGWHILSLKEVIPSKVKEFDKVKEEIRKDLLADKIDTHLVETSNMVDDALAGGEALEDVAKDLHLDIKKLDAIREDGSTADDKDGLKGFESGRADILAAAFSLEAGETSSVQELANGTYVVVRVENITPKTYRPFEEVKADLEKTWTADQRDVLNRRRATEALTALQSETQDLEAIAKEYNLQVKKENLVNNKPVTAPLTEALKGILFNQDKGTYQLAPVDNGYAIAYVTDIKSPNAEKASKEDMDALRQTSAKGTQDEIFLIYFNELKKEYGVDINRRTLDSLYASTAEPQF
ncbi:MAG: peptidyl-prolyl cis-trans isomerase [Micavibrio sp.]